MTSHDVVRQVRRICRTRKVGHAGTLDPLATGVLPVAVGHGTKILQFLLADNKSYRATLQLGRETDTLDSEGTEIRTSPVGEFTLEQLETACSCFRGAIEQVPPMYSALKKNGVPLYKLARQGKILDLAARSVTIQRLEISAVELPDFSIEVACSKGTYIRSLVRDIGEKLGCGAHLTALRRLTSGTFRIEDCLTLEQLEQVAYEDIRALSLDGAMVAYPAVQVLDAAVESLSFGIPPKVEQTDCGTNLKEGELVRLQIENQLAAMARYAPARQQEKRGDFELIRVFVGPKVMAD